MAQWQGNKPSWPGNDNLEMFVVSPVPSDKEESSGSPYTPLMDPYGGDDGGIMDGNTRVSLHNNGDGTMSDDRGNTYKRDGNDVRKL